MPSRPSSRAALHILSSCTVKPMPAVAPPPAEMQRVHLTPWDLAMLSAHYIQKGLLFPFPPPDLDVVHRLKSSLAVALRHFYPLAGRLVTESANPDDPSGGLYVAIDCSGEGAEFIHAAAREITVADVLAGSGDDVPAFVQSFFSLDGAVDHDGHTLPLLVVQLTELKDGVFLGCCFNHVVGDGTSYWHFFNAWAEISRNEDNKGLISRPPVLDRWFIDGATPPLKLPFTHSSQFVERFSPPSLRERIFHLSSDSISRLKSMANYESKTNNANVISSFQALSALLWRCITRARSPPAEQKTSCRLAIQNRARLHPPLSPDYFGNSIYVVSATVTASELLAHGLGWAAALLRECVAGHTDASIRERVEAWVAAPVVYSLRMFDEWSVMMGSSPRFEMYECEFGWGRGAAVRSGTANKFCGKVTSYPGREGGGSVDVEVCLKPKYMAALESDPEFMAAVSTDPCA